MKFYFGVTSKNIVDLVLQYSLDNPSSDVCFIPSRRQVDYTGGYSGFTTQSFAEYVKSINPKVKIERDHGGPAQGAIIDNGYDSLKEDCKYFDIIHIDPWKYCDTFIEGIQWTIDMINYCYALNTNIEFEIATEEAIRPFSTHDLKKLLSELKNTLPVAVFKKIKYCVIQCGTSLCEAKNIGVFNSERLVEMIEVCNKYGLIAKEHNGDWVHKDMVQKKKQYGLEHINIAPELSCLESSIILDTVKQNHDDYTSLFKICLASEKWKRWVSNDFNPYTDKDTVIITSCQYLFCDERFLKIKRKYPRIDEIIREKLFDRILDLFDVYTIRKKCIFCNESKLDELFPTNTQTSLSLSFGKKGERPEMMPFNVVICSSCKTVQTKYLGNLGIIYSKNHIDNCGSLKQTMHDSFSQFILDCTSLTGFIEVGACYDSLSSRLRKVKQSLPYTVIDPAYTSSIEDIEVVPDFLENTDLTKYGGNTVVMSNLFEHLYNPVQILEKLQSSHNIQHIFLNHPDFEHNIRTNTYVVLNSEHTFYLEHNTLIAYFQKYGFKLEKRNNFTGHTIFLHFQRCTPQDITEPFSLTNKQTKEEIEIFYSKMDVIIFKLNKYIDKNPQRKFYLWPASAHSISMFPRGFNYKNLQALLDNSPNKIGKYLHGYDLYCDSFKTIVDSNDPNVTIIISGAGQYIREISTSETKVEFLNIHDI
jgi:fructose/tagatose bisphosphate aldolase